MRSQTLALVDVATDREVGMLYSSFLRALGPGLIWAYGPEGCVWQGFLHQLRSFEWADVAGPPDGAQAAALRKSLRAALWASAHPRLVLGITAASAWLLWRWRRK